MASSIQNRRSPSNHNRHGSRVRAVPGSSGSHLMTDGEFDAFFRRADARFSPKREVDIEADTDSEAEALVVSMLARGCEVQMVSVSSRIGKPGRGRSARTNRCGSCIACSAKDCGTCKNCRDKPR